jgi:SET domain-containing protein
VGEIINEGEVKERTKKLSSEGVNFAWDLGADSDHCIDPLKFGNFARMLNHSCDPNVSKRKVFVDHHRRAFPRIGFFSRRDIAIGEELCVDYGWAVNGWPGPCMPCRCGKPECRGILL